ADVSHYIEENDFYVAAGFRTPRARQVPYLESVETWIGGNDGSCYVAHISASSDGVQPGVGSTAPTCYVGPPEPREISQLCPLVLDLNGDGIHTTGLDDAVMFWDRNFDGVSEPSGWIDAATEEGFLFLDLDGDHEVTQTELFGSAMHSFSGDFHPNGFQALDKYDTLSYGGNADGEITRSDRVWPRLRLWIDANHDGRSQPFEITPLDAHQIVSLGLSRVHDHAPDANGNGHMLVGSYSKRVRGEVISFAMVDVSFVYTS
ncbi:MAG: hypothetical protein ACLGH0_04505, partial [Thermoanaerobaculia bacterium]